MARDKQEEGVARDKLCEDQQVFEVIRMLVPFDEELLQVAHVLEQGARKHGVGDWQKRGFEGHRDAIDRHLLSWEHHGKDEDSGQSPLAHVIGRCLILMALERMANPNGKTGGGTC